MFTPHIGDPILFVVATCNGQIDPYRSSAMNGSHSVTPVFACSRGSVASVDSATAHLVKVKCTALKRVLNFKRDTQQMENRLQ